MTRSLLPENGSPFLEEETKHLTKKNKQINVNKVKVFALQGTPLRNEKELTDERNCL